MIIIRPLITRGDLISAIRGVALAAVCVIPQTGWSQSKPSGSQASNQAVVTYRGESLTRSDLNQILQAQKQAMQGSGQASAASQKDMDLFAVYGWLRDEALLAAAEEMKVQPDQNEIKKQEQELRKQLTPENWKKMQAGAQFAIQSVDRYREGLRSGAKNDAQLRDSIWQEMGGERNPSGVPRQAFDQTLTACGRDDKAYMELKDSIPQSVDDAITKAREELTEASRLMRVHDRIAGQAKVTDEDVARAKQTIPAQAQQEMGKAPGGFKGALLAMKKQHTVDEWLRPRILSQAKFGDKNLENRFRAMLEQVSGQGGSGQQAPPPAAGGAPQRSARR